MVKLDVVAEQLNGLALKCRGNNNHWWDVEARTPTVVTKGWIEEYAVLYVCRTCDSTREDHYNSRLALIRRRYNYSDIFKVVLPKGRKTKPTRAAYRAAFLARELKEIMDGD